MAAKAKRSDSGHSTPQASTDPAKETFWSPPAQQLLSVWSIYASATSSSSTRAPCRLPHGTEVVTRVDRIVGERRVPQGSVGRVTQGRRRRPRRHRRRRRRPRYARDELSPRRVGQALFAQRRADAWEALGRASSSRRPSARTRGVSPTRRPTSIAAASSRCPFTWTQGLVAPPEDLVSADGSATYWAAGKAIRQALRADPNTLEMLFLPSAKAARSDRRVAPRGARRVRVGRDLRHVRALRARPAPTARARAPPRRASRASSSSGCARTRR